MPLSKNTAFPAPQSSCSTLVGTSTDNLQRLGPARETLPGRLGVFRQDGPAVISLSHLLVARRLLSLAGTLISLCPPASITLLQVSYWSTSGQKLYVYFLFSLIANFSWKIEFDAQGQDGKLGKIAYFPNMQPFAPLSNEWQNKINKITVGDAPLCRLASLSI